MKKSLIFFTLLILFFAASCEDIDSNSSQIAPTQSNPNGDSELALLMREMFEDGMRIKQQIERGEKPEFLKKFEAIHTAEATEPEKAASDTYKHFGDAYLKALESLQNANSDELFDAYQGMVTSCMSCHQALCPGPMVRIKKLYLEN